MSQISEDDRLLRSREVADLFKVSAKTVTRWAKTGKLHSVLTPGGQTRYRKSDVDKYLNGGGEAA